FTLYVFHFYISLGWKKVIAKISVVLFISFSITILTTIIGLYSVPNAARILTSSSSSINESTLLTSKNIGGFDLVYGLIILIPSLISIILFKNEISNIWKLFLFIFIISSILLVVNASFTIAVILLILSVFLGIFSKLKPKTMVMLLLLIFFISIIIPKDPISTGFKQVSQFTNNTYISERFEDMGNFVIGNNNSIQHLDNRTSKYSMSFNTFVENPITGIGSYYYVDGVGIGYHSQILDNLARYGVFGLLFYILFFYTFYMFVKKIWNQSNLKANFFVSLFTFLFISLLNPTFS